MKELQIGKHTFKEYEILSFEIDKQTLDDFKTLIYNLENLGVYMDFIWEEDFKFTNEENSILHIIENNEIKATWSDLAQKNNQSYRSNIVRVDLGNTPDIYFIFADIIFNKLTNIVFDFYEGEGDVHISFFKNKCMQDIRGAIDDSNYIDEELELVEDELEDL